MSYSGLPFTSSSSNGSPSGTSSDIAVAVRGLSKAYFLAHQQKQTTIREELLQKVRRPFQKQARETFWALKDVDFDIARGDVVGIIGRNGAGKSTLLKILSNITRPTRGYVDLFGRVGSLLEVGTGFHLELTGRENIFLNGAILGMRKREIERQFDAIVEFSGVERFLDTPVKRYSSGMFVRLAFAVAAHLNPDILIIDEVLAVGDAEFQKKCLGKMQDVAQEQGRTVLFVSHNEAAVRRLCKSAIFLRSGQVEFIGSPEEAFNYYREQRSDLSFDPSNRRASSGAATVIDARLRVDGLIVNEILGGAKPVLELDVEVVSDVKFYPEIMVRDGDFLPIMFSPMGLAQRTLYQLAPGFYRLSIELEFPFLAAGKYFLDFALAQFNITIHDLIEGALGFSVAVTQNEHSIWSFEQSNRQSSILLHARELGVEPLTPAQVVIGSSL